MKKKLLIVSTFILVILMFTGFSIGQESTYLAQKLMLENDMHRRTASALGKILEDHRYVLDISVDLQFTPTVREEVTYQPEDKAGVPVDATSRTSQQNRRSQLTDDEATRKRMRSTGIPIPGFDFQIEEESETEEPVDTKPIVEESKITTSGRPKIVSQSYVDIKSSMPVINKLEISCILPEGSSPELIENVRQIIKVASHFDRNRGDVLSIMTASFRERKNEKTAEAIILRSIAEKMDKLERQSEDIEIEKSADWREELLQWREEEAKRREEDRAIWRTELEKLENERLRRKFDKEKQAILARDSVKLDDLTNEINQLKGLLATASLSVEETQKTEEEVIVKEQEKAKVDALIEEKLAMLKDAQEEISRLEGGMNNLPIYLMSAISLLAVIALAAVILLNGRGKPKYVVPPPWMMQRRPPVKKKVKNKSKSKRESQETGTESVPPQQPVQMPAKQVSTPPPEDPSVMQSEIKSVRQSIVSMAVGQPDTATTIVKEWLEEEAPPPPEPEQSAAPEASKEEEDDGKKKKRKK